MTRIAIVEDNRIIRESLAAYVHTDREFSCVCLCASAEEALQSLPRHKPDVVLMDIQLPDLSGIECTARLKQLLPGVRVIMVTVYGDPERIFKALRAGACGYLLKRSKPADVVPAIRDALDGGGPMSPEIARKVIEFFQETPATTPDTAGLEDLSPREREILELAAKGYSGKDIAQLLGVRHGTVRWHLQHVYEKLHVRSRIEAVLKFRSASPDKAPSPDVTTAV
jgi:DNA-binding NarL/FixJ family response regulator